MRTLTIRQFAAVKRVAQNVNYAVTKRNKVAEQITRLNQEYNDLTEEIEGHEAGIVKLTGCTSEELVVKVVENTGKMDKDGKPIKVTKYEPREDRVRFNEEKKVYEILEETPAFTETPVGTPDEVDDTEKVGEVEGEAPVPVL